MNDKVKQFIAFGVCSVVALALCIGVLVVTVNNIDEDINAPQSIEYENKTELDETKETLGDYFNSLVEDTKNRFVKTKSYTNISVNDISVSENTDKYQVDAEIFTYVKDKILPDIDAFYPEDLIGTFENQDSIKTFVHLNTDYINNATFSIGQVNENGESVYNDEGELVDAEFYYLTFDLDGGYILNDKALYEAFLMNNDSKAEKNFIKSVEKNCSVNDLSAEINSVTVTVKVNRTNDQIEYINVIKNYHVKFNANFINSAEFFGNKEISFNYTVTDAYEYSYAGISFVEDKIRVDFNEEYMLNVNAIIDNDSDYTVEFISSDESVVSVDEMGYIKAIKQTDKPVIITVKLNYLGETFTDTCIVNVSEE